MLRTRNDFRADRADASLKDVQRYDVSVLLRAPRRSPEGFLYADAYMARAPIVMEYTQPDGSIIRELVLPEDLHDGESLKTLAGKPITDDHPSEEVTAANATVYSRGAVRDGSAVAEDGHVRVPIVIHDAALIAKTTAGKQEVSPGYRVDLEDSPGVHETAGPYDRIQRRRRYNHLAVVDAARGGSTVRLRADGNAEIIGAERRDGAPTMDREKLIAALADLTGKTRADAASAYDALAGLRADDTLGDVLKRLNDAEGSVASLTKERDALKAQVDEFEALKKKNEDPEEQKKQKGDALAATNEIVALRKTADAQGVAYDVKTDDAGDLRKKIVDAADVPEGTERSDAFDRAFVAMLGAKGGSTAPAWAGLNIDGKPPKKDADKPQSGVVKIDGRADAVDLLSLDTRNNATA